MTFLGNEKLSKADSWKAIFSIIWRDEFSSNLIFASDLHPEKEQEPISVTFLGM